MSDLREKSILALHQIFTNQPISEDSENSGFCKMLFLTTCRNAVSLKIIINHYLNKKIPHKQSLLETILLTASAELLFMESPDYAVINSYVNITKKLCGKTFSGFVNAVLHKVLNDKDILKKNYNPKFFPEPFKKILSLDYSEKTINEIEPASTRQPPLNITVKENPSHWTEILKATPVTTKTLSLSTEGKIESLTGFEQGAWWVQDTAAALAVPQFSKLTGKRVLDLCAAPGGKTAQLINLGAKVTSVDCSEQRLEILKKNLKRLQLKPEKIICADALQYLKDFKEEPFDAVLLDAPCSATGIFRRHPEIVYLKTIKDVEKQASLQQKILENISPVLKTKGELIYCTCSISKIEGEKQITKFLTTHKNYNISPLSIKEEPLCTTPEGFIRTLPFHFAGSGGCDAFFIAKLIKENNDGC